MPAVPGLVLLFATTFPTAAAFLGGMIVKFAAVAAISYAANKLFAPNIPSFRSDVKRRQQIVRSSVEPHRVIYGQAMASGPLIFAESTNDDKVLHLVIALAGHECEEIVETYFNDTLSTDARFSRRKFTSSTISFTPSSSTQGIIRNTDLHWEHKIEPGDGVYIEGPPTAEGLYFVLDRPNQNDVEDHYMYAERITGGNFPTLSAGTSTDIYLRYGHVIHHLGDTAGNPFGGELNGVGSWGASHTLKGITALYAILIQDPKRRAFPNGIPNIKCLVKGKKVYDPRDSSTAWSDNWALCMRDYITNTQYGLSATSVEIDDIAVEVAADICDQVVDVENTSETQARYTCNGILDTGVQPIDNVKQLLTAAAGAMIWANGQYRIFAGSFPDFSSEFSSEFLTAAPVRVIDEDDLAAPIRVRASTPRKELFNGVAGVFSDASQNYIAVDYKTYKNTTYATEDGDEILTTLDLPYTTDAYAAQRLAKLHLEQSRQNIIVDITGKHTLMDVAAWDIVQVNMSHLGWNDTLKKYFRVISWTLNEQGGVNLVLKEDAAGVYNWTTLDETTVDLSPNTNLPSPWDIAAPDTLTLSSGTDQLVLGTDGTLLTRIKVEWSYPTDAQPGWYEIEYKKTAATLWTGSGRVYHGPYWILGVEDGIDYDVRILAVSHIGARSDWLVEKNYTVVGKTEPPPDVTNFSVIRQSDGTRQFTIIGQRPADFAGFRLKYEAAINDPLTAWGNLSDLLDVDPSTGKPSLVTQSPWETNQLAAGNYTIAVKMVDTTGNESTNAKYITSTLGDPRIGSALITDDIKRAGFPDTKTSCWYDTSTGNLLPANQDTWADLPSTWAAWTAWNTNPVASMSYETDTYDIGAVVVFTPLVTAETDDGTGTIDTYERHRDDPGDPWSSYTATGSPITARYIQIKVTVTTPPVGGVDRLQVILSADTIEEYINDLDTSTVSSPAGDLRVPITKNYGLITTVQVALQNVGSGFSWELIDKNPTTGPRIKIYNGASLADATIDVLVIGLA